MNNSDMLKSINEDAEEAVITKHKMEKKNPLLLLGFVGLALGASFFAYQASMPTPKNQKQTQEDFRPGDPFAPPSFSFDKPKPPADNILKLPPPPPSPPPAPQVTTFNVPPPPVQVSAPPTPLPAQQKSEDNALDPRFTSKMMAFDYSSPQSGSGSSDLTRGQSGPVVAGTDSNSKYLANLAQVGSQAQTATKIARIDALVAQGTIIPGILETAISSDLPGEIRAITSSDVYSFDGRRVLIPAGTRLIGEYNSDITTGQTRIFIIWTRLIRNDGVSVRLDSYGTDQIGRSGLTGDVDNHWRARFGSAILLSMVGGASSYVAGGTSTSDTSAAYQARQTMAESFSQMSNQTLEKTISIPPTINVQQGARINIFVRRDLDFSAFYPDPVTEAEKEILHERRN
ncbi:type IV secretion system protein VirB10 [Allorhizobium sp. BGMRC 0089]|uniref:type IV secretion system protein VirB10 n=1 Tax=Allorhizobium sonneratiae TaxID=2934936 RepID=UPI0020346A71|nr:type IV secretion system protein VirB10 [Allorhizobium sonneratiae]MCM2294711.1 type IV secretion system protein VirB10 [Allorhizobium sonneratiae]